MTTTIGTATDTMRAVVQDGYGDTGVLRATAVPRPVPGDTEVLVRVSAAGLDRGTWHMMAGRPLVARAALGLRRQKQPVPGLDLAGRVVAVGADVSRFAVGDAVFGIGTGTFAELAVAPEHKLVALPSSLSFVEAAAMPVSGITALRAVDHVGEVREGHRVLILGASGGVGSFAVQIAVARGADVTAVCSGPKADAVRGLGAAHVVDHTLGDSAEAELDRLAGGAGYDVIVDIGGNRTLRRLRRLLAARGTLVIVGGEGGGRWLGGLDRQARALMWSPFVRQRLTFVIASEHHEPIERLLAMVVAGQVRPVLDRDLGGGGFGLDGVPAAMQRLIDGDVTGKLVIEI